MNTIPNLESGPLPMPSVHDDHASPSVLSAEGRNALAMMAALAAGETFGVDVALDRFGIGLVGELVFRGCLDIDATGGVVLTDRAAPEVMHFDRLRELAQMCTCGRDRGEHLVEPPHGAEDGRCDGFTLADASPATRDTPTSSSSRATGPRARRLGGGLEDLEP